MRISGSIYLGEEGRTYLALYSAYEDLFRKAPPSMQDPKYIAHIDYTTKSVKRAIDVFLLYKNIEKINEVDTKRIIYLSEEKLDNINDKYNINYQLIKGVKDSKIVEEISFFIQKDVKDFCKDKTAKVYSKSKTDFVDEIIPKTKIKLVKDIKNYLQSGKQDFVPSCGLEANLDFSKGCISSFVPSSNANFNGDNFTGFFFDPFSSCDYCYSIYQQDIFPRIIKIDAKKLEEELIHGNFVGADGKIRQGKINFLRLGKSTESGCEYTLDSLIATLETCVKTKTRVIMPTKYLKFNREVAELLKKTDSRILYSIGYDEFEKGAGLHNCNNQFRLEQCLFYKQQGINSIIYLLINPTTSLKERELRILKFAERNKIPVQFIPLRITSKDFALKFTGFSWDELKENNKQLIFIKNKDQIGKYKYEKGNLLTPRRIDPSYCNLIDDNTKKIRMCYHNCQKTYCGRCFLDDKGSITQTQEVKITYQKNRRGQIKPRRKIQIGLFD